MRRVLVDSVREVVREKGRGLRAVVLYGSVVYCPWRARDIDVLVVVDRLDNVHEKFELERVLRRVLVEKLRVPVDVAVFDVESLCENLVPGTFLSGFVLGYDVLYDEIGFDKLIVQLFEKVAAIENYVYAKKKKWRLSDIARAKVKALD